MQLRGKVIYRKIKVMPYRWQIIKVKTKNRAETRAMQSPLPQLLECSRKGFWGKSILSWQRRRQNSVKLTRLGRIKIRLHSGDVNPTVVGTRKDKSNHAINGDFLQGTHAHKQKLQCRGVSLLVEGLRNFNFHYA